MFGNNNGFLVKKEPYDPAKPHLNPTNFGYCERNLKIDIQNQTILIEKNKNGKSFIETTLKLKEVSVIFSNFTLNWLKKNPENHNSKNDKTIPLNQNFNINNLYPNNN
jgi:hypothetical protein